MICEYVITEENKRGNNVNYKCSRCLASQDDLCLCQFQGSTLPVAASTYRNMSRNKRIRNISRLFVDGSINNRTASVYTRAER